MRRLVLALAALCAAAPLAAQQKASPADPDHNAKGSGALPAGWHLRFDHADASPSAVKFVTMGSGFHATSGPAAIYWRGADVASGNYTAEATFVQSRPSAHPEAYGIFVGGKDLTAADQNYLYFIVRQDGKYMVKHRAGEDVHTIIPWTASAAVHPLGADGKAASNTIRVVAASDSVRAFVNGQQIFAGERSYVGGNGQVGLRVNHNLDVHIAGFKVTKSH